MTGQRFRVPDSPALASPLTRLYDFLKLPANNYQSDDLAKVFSKKNIFENDSLSVKDGFSETVSRFDIKFR